MITDLLPAGSIEAFVLYLVRTSVLILASPLLGRTASFSGYKITLTIGVSAVLYMATGSPLGPDVTTGAFVLMALREVMIGLFLAFVLHLVVVALDVAGQLIGHEIGLTMASVVDPVTGSNTPLITGMYETVFFLALLAVDGHHWILRALGASLERAPVGSMRLDASIPDLLLEVFGQMFAAGLTFAAPILVLLSLVSLLLGLLARMVPQLNVLEVGFTLRIGVGLLALFFFSPLLTPAMERLFELLDEALDSAVSALAA